MKLLLTTALLITFSTVIFSQNVRVEKPVFSERQELNWGTDLVLLPNEPVGPMHGVQGPDSAIYFAFNDTISTNNLGLVIRKSTDGGETWNTPSGVTYRGLYENIKLLRSTNAVYCLFQIDYSVYCWNVASDTVHPFIIPGYRAFDAEITSTNTIYLFLDSLANNTLLRYASLNGGANWINRGNISSGAAFPKVTKSLSGDTLFLNYYGPILPDTLTSILRVARYRELAAGTVTSAGFQDLAAEAVIKNEYGMAVNNGEVYFVYTTAGSKSELWMRKSTDNGTTYAAAVKLNSDDNVNQYLFDLKAKRDGSGSFNYVYYSDSVQAGPASAQTDRILYGKTAFGGSSFAPFTQINEIPAALPSGKGRTILVELPLYSNTGIAWIGEENGTKKVFWDTFNGVVPVELTSFSAAVSGTVVTLNWETATETNNYGFEVEKRTNSVSDDWKKIAFIRGNGTTLTPTAYSYSDQTAPGIFLYRLKQIDMDGSVTYSKVVEADLSPVSDYALGQNYPNPFNPSTVITYQLPLNGAVQLKVYDILGKEVATLVNNEQTAGSYEVTFNAAGLAGGIYFYSLQSGNYKETKKLVLMK